VAEAVRLAIEMVEQKDGLGRLFDARDHLGSAPEIPRAKDAAPARDDILQILETP